MKVKKIKEKVILTTIYFVLIMSAYFLKVSCIYLQLFGITCPGCGMTRAFLSAIKFDFTSAFKFHFMFWGVPILYLYFLYDGNLFKNKKINRAVIIIIGFGFLINWIINLMNL